MKKIILYSIAFICTLTVTAQSSRSSQTTADGCNKATASWGSSLGRVSFVSNKTWKVGKQEWSDVITAANCQKTTFSGGGPGSFSADCRQDSGRGDLFSWCAAVRFQRQLCTRGWRMPTKDDYMTLKKNLEDIQKQVNSKKSTNFVSKYMFFGPTFEAYASNPQGELVKQGSFAQYWSTSEFGPNHGFHLSINISDDMYPLANSNKAFGFTLRCVKDLPKTAPVVIPVMVELPKD